MNVSKFLQLAKQALPNAKVTDLRQLSGIFAKMNLSDDQINNFTQALAQGNNQVPMPTGRKNLELWVESFVVPLFANLARVAGNTYAAYQGIFPAALKAMAENEDKSISNAVRASHTGLGGLGTSAMLAEAISAMKGGTAKGLAETFASSAENVTKAIQAEKEKQRLAQQARDFTKYAQDTNMSSSLVDYNTSVNSREKAAEQWSRELAAARGGKNAI